MSVVYQKVSGTYNEFSYMVKKKKKKRWDTMLASIYMLGIYNDFTPTES